MLSSGNHSQSYSRRQSKVLTAKSMAKLLGQCSSTVWAGLTGKHKHREYPSLLQSLLATTGSLEEKVLPLLLYWLSSTVKKVLMLCRYQAATMSHLFSCEMKFSMELARRCCQPKQRPSLHSILQSFIGLWVNIWHRNKTAYSDFNPVQRSRSKLMTSLRKGSLLRLE